MKNLKKIALSLLVACLAIGFSAFTNGDEKLQTDWYEPASPLLTSDPDVENFSKYDPIPLEVAPIEDCVGDTYVCAAYFPNTSQPAQVIYDKD